MSTNRTKTFIFLGYILFLVSIALSSIELLFIAELILIPFTVKIYYKLFKKLSYNDYTN